MMEHLVQKLNSLPVRQAIEELDGLNGEDKREVILKIKIPFRMKQYLLEKYNLPGVMDLVKINGEEYYVDFRLKQYRNVNNPGKIISF